MPAQRLIFAALLLGTAAAILTLAAACLAPGGWDILKALLLLNFAVIAVSLGVSVGNAVPGLLILMLAQRPPRFVLPVRGDIDTAPITARTAILVTVRNENMDVVLPPMRRLLDALAPWGDRFALCILSDTQDPALAAAEARAVGLDSRLIYRRRGENTGFKAGNVMEFLDHHAAGFEFAVMLDADSVMSAAAVLTLVRIMQADSRLAIVQNLTVGRPASSVFPRLFQFGMRAGMRAWATGQAWWQGDEGPYWGHNAILRIAPFRAHARLDPLPDGAAILSHDQVEAARLCAAGWKVCVWADEAGSSEANPPALPEFLHRDDRWLAGNLQYMRLLRLPGFRPMGRWQLVQAILLFAGAPCHMAVLALAALLALRGAEFGSGPLAALILAWLLAAHAPKLAGYVQVLLTTSLAARYGGRVPFAIGAAAEFVFALLLEGITQLAKTQAMLRLALGARPGWLPQNRADRGVSWTEATCLLWPHTVCGLLLAIPLGPASLPWTAGLLLAIPFCVATSDPGVGAWFRRHRIAATPEELLPSGE